MRRALPERLARLPERVERCDGGGMTAAAVAAVGVVSVMQVGYYIFDWRGCRTRLLVLTEVVRVLAEHGNSHGTDAAGHRRDVRALRGALNRGERPGDCG